MMNQGREGRSLLAKNSVFNLLGQILPMLVGIFTIPYIIKGLGSDGYGILSIAYMVLGYFGIFDLGLSRATVKFVAEHLSPDQIHKIPELVWTSLLLLVALGCAGGCLLAAFVPVAVTHWFKMPPSFIGQARWSLYILAASMPIMLSNDALRGVLEAAQRFDLVNYVKVPGSVLFYLLAALAVPFKIHVPGIVFLLVLVRLSTSFAYLSLCFRVFPELKRHIHISKVAIRPLTAFGGWIMVSNITGPIFGWIERFMIASFLSVGMLTYYSVPFDLVSKIVIFPASIAPALFPYFSFHGTKGAGAVSDVTSRAIKYLLLVMTPATAFFVLFAKDILRIWLGQHFAVQSAVVLQLIAVMFFVNAFAFVPYSSVQAMGRPDLKAILDLVTLPTYALYCWWFMKTMGIDGAALAKLLSAVIDTSFLFFFAFRMRAFSLRDCLSGRLLRALVASAGLLLASWLIGSLQASLTVSLVLFLVCAVLYGSVFWLAAIDSDERGVILRLSPIALTKRPTPATGVGTAQL
jgi:O-antigen/teichoic acid export membrane protein